MTIRRIRAVLKIDKRRIRALLAAARAIHDGMMANPALFPSPNPALAVLLALIQALEALQQASPRTTQTTAARNAKRDVLYTALESERMVVQGLCDANPEQAETLIKAAAMAVGKAPARAKPVIDAREGTQPGSVLLIANATLLVGKRVHRKHVFNWQMSADGGKTWVSLPSTPFARTLVQGLTPLTTYAFRVSATVGDVAGEWSQAVTILAR